MTTMQDTAPPSTRVTQGIALANEHEERISRIYAHTWIVPSCSGDETYIVRTDRGTCDCPDRADACKHSIAVEIVASRRRRARVAG